MRKLTLGIAAAMVVIVAIAAPPSGEARLALRPGAVWWRAGSAPSQWKGPDATVTAALRWQPGRPGVEWAELPIAGQGEARALNLVVARIDPAAAHLRLVWSLEGDGARPSWSIAHADSADVAFNAGMFVDALPWGWVVLEGSERLAPGKGPLSSALIGRRDGSLAWVDGDDVSAWRRRDDVAFAFQSYPTLLTGNGEVPAALRQDGSINLTHRDARLAIGLDRSGRLLVALTRFDTDVAGLDRVPFGVSVPEMAAVMGALGAKQAMLLDGGISAQLLVRDAGGAPHTWPGIRRVPLALVGTSR